MKITFLGAGSSVFTKNVLGDVMLTDSITDLHIALYDIDGERLNDSKAIMDTLNANINSNRARITAHLGVDERKQALASADFIVNAIQVGGYDPSTIIDFEIPKKYGLRQTIGDTLGVAGIFRALRTIPVLADIAKDIEEVCPDAWFLNYTNPMSILTGYMQRFTAVKTVGLCHSVQKCASKLLRTVDMEEFSEDARWKIAGINHMGWLLEITDSKGADLYPEIRRRAAEKNAQARRAGAEKHNDMVRFDILEKFGYYNTESSEHTAEYHPYYIKNQFPDLIEEFNIPLDEYPRRCKKQIEEWKKQREELINDNGLGHEKTHEYASATMDAIVNDNPLEIGGNVINHGMIPNLPEKACVEIPCLVNRNGVQGVYVGTLPEHLAALNRTHINVHLVTLDAAVEKKREHVYHAAMLDPHTRSELKLDEIRKLCDEMFEAHAEMIKIC
ncbi:MAG: alpha-glucosidase/alpha-galactosidase [Verrucomicrobiota bacterium]